MEVESMNIEHEEGIVEDGSVDYRGRTPSRATTGAWKAATFIIGEHLTFLFLFHRYGHHLLSNYRPHAVCGIQI